MNNELIAKYRELLVKQWNDAIARKQQLEEELPKVTAAVEQLRGALTVLSQMEQEITQPPKGRSKDTA